MPEPISVPADAFYHPQLEIFSQVFSSEKRSRGPSSLPTPPGPDFSNEAAFLVPSIHPGSSNLLSFKRRKPF